MAIGSAAFTLTSQFDSAQVQSSVDRLNATVAATVKDVNLNLGAQLDSTKVDAAVAQAAAKIAKTQANVKLGADVQNTQIDAAIADARAKIMAASETIGTSSGQEMQSGFEGVMSPQFLVPAVTASLSLLPGLFAVAGSAGAIALGAAFAVAASPALQRQGEALVSGLEQTVESAASVLDKPIQAAFTTLSGELPVLKGLLSSTFSAVAPEIQPVVTMLTEIVNSALPGFNALLQQSAGPMGQFFVTTGKIVGTGLDKFFEALGPGAASSLTDIDGLLNVLFQVADEAAKVSSEIAGIPSLLNKLGGSLNAASTPLASLGKALHIPDSGDNLIQALPKFFSWMGQHMPGGNASILQLAEGSSSAATGMKAAGDSAQKAAPKFQQLSTPVQQLGAALNTAAGDTTKLDAAWANLVGNFVGEQQGILNARQAVDSYAQAVKQSGASSDTAQQAFYSAAQSLGQMVDAMVKAHAPAATIYGDLEQQIGALKAKGPLNDQEKQALADLQKAADGVAASSSGLTAQMISLAGVSEDNLLPSLTALHTPGTLLNNDMTALANSILNTGTQSDATQSARAALIGDLEKAGINATTAQGDVDAFQKSIDALHGKTVPITADVAGAEAGVTTFTQLVDAIPKSVAVQLTTSISGANLNQIATALGGNAAGGIVGAAGGMIVRGSGPSGRDSQLILAAPGEMIVPTSHVPAFRDMARRASIPGFAAGGYASEPVFSSAGVPYSYADYGNSYSTPAAASAGNAGLPGATQFGQTTTNQLLTDIRKQLAQLPYAQAQAINQANSAGMSRAWFSTGG